jgi:hypothetical protein
MHDVDVVGMSGVSKIAADRPKSLTTYLSRRYPTAKLIGAYALTTAAVCLLAGRDAGARAQIRARVSPDG